MGFRGHRFKVQGLGFVVSSLQLMNQRLRIGVRVLGFKVEGLVFRILGLRVEGWGYRVHSLWLYDSCYRVLGFKDSRVQDLGLKVQGSGFRAQGLRFRICGLGLRVEGCLERFPGLLCLLVC